MTRFSNLITWPLLLLFWCNRSYAQKINVQVLYESLCPDSLKFITEQLYPAWFDLSPHVNLHLVPFGKSASIRDSNGLHFVCQHGPKECAGNKIQSCALSAIKDQNAQVEFVNCFMRVFRKGINGNDELGQNCAEKVGLDWNYVSDCFSSKLGTDLQLQAEQVTGFNPPKFVPKIIYNGKFNQAAQDDSINNFRRVICSYVTQIHPAACQSSRIVQL